MRFFRSMLLGILGIFSTVEAVAQGEFGLTAFEMSAVDENGVDLITGYSSHSLTDLSIGPSLNGLSHTIHSFPNSFRTNQSWISNDIVDNFSGGITTAGDYGYCDNYSVSVASSSEIFCKNGSNFEPHQNKPVGSQLIDVGGGIYHYFDGYGTKYIFDEYYSGGQDRVNSIKATLTEIEYPDGRRTFITYKQSTYGSEKYNRIQSVHNNTGFQLKYFYQRNSAPTNTSQVQKWVRPIRIVALNNAVEYCNPAANSCSFTNSWPEVLYSRSFPGNDSAVLTVTDQAGAQTRYTMEKWSSRLIKVKSATSLVDDIEYDHCETSQEGPPYRCYSYTWDNSGLGPSWLGGPNNSDKVILSYRKGEEWEYDFDVIAAGYPGFYTEYRSISPLGRTMIVHSRIEPGLSYVQWISADSARADFDNQSMMTQYTSADGTVYAYTYDARGNITRIDRGSDHRLAGYDATCQYASKCNKPNWVDDWRGNRTNFEYYTPGGQVKAIKQPAVNSVRPEKWYYYESKNARVKNSSGQLTNGTGSISVLTKEEFCKTSARVGSSCAVSGDEVEITYEYNPSTVGHNLQIIGQVYTADGVSLRTCYKYDKYGNKIAETLPKANLASCL